MTENNNKTELSALISLLDEPDKGMYQQIEQKIYSYGEQAIPLLEEAWSSTIHPDIQERMELIIGQIQKEKLCREIDYWARVDSQDLLKGFILVSQYEYPNLSVDQITRKIGDIIQDVWLELNNSLSPLEKTKVFNHIIYEIQGFKANKKDILAVDNCCINRLIESKRGNALSLGILYSIVAQALKIPIMGIDLPRHFVLSYINEEKLNAPIKQIKREDVLFYLNPFYKGVVFSEKEINVFIRQLKQQPQERFYLPANNITIIYRLLNELRYTYTKANLFEKSKSLDHLISILQKYRG